ncbi:uncharacterized protein RAG0_00192 [Rhynchosporium agropyri]|uniref:Deacetylase sirtuin-type domain-containing protein n=1 Tax=Rhynchosporium agropyri TaxID=914238 RepID=A0A1E1JS07_9HELO|nr:uncharacterized protein RAG0_00192 [Rhynchosporium agropyri]
MPTIQVGPDSDLQLQVVADIMGNSKKVVVVTGAGISTNCGIPDFRSQNGLYSMVQAQFDAALKNPPWEKSDEFDIDDRPRKKRKQWYYEVVAPDGKVVDVIDEEIAPPETTQPENSQPEKSSPEVTQLEPSQPDNLQPDIFQPASSHEFQTPHAHKRSSRSRSSITNTTTSDSRATTPSVISSTESSLSSCTSLTPEVPVSFSEIALSNDKSPSFARAISTNSIAVANHIFDTRQSSEASSPPPSHSLSTQDISFREKSFNAQPLSQNSTAANRQSLPNLKGRDLFDAMVWQDAFTTSIFYMFISSLRQRVKRVTTTTQSHKLLRVLRDGGRLVRNYSQNIDLLEEREGLCTDLSMGTGSRGRFSRRIGVGVASGSRAAAGGCESVTLHGSLERLRCSLCNVESNWDQEARMEATLAGSAPDCPTCEANSNKRTGNGRRKLAVGRLRPDIVLYGEDHPKAHLVSTLVTHDLALGPDVLLIMGTSLRVHGLKVMVKEFAKAVHAKGGKVVFVNNTKPPESIWGDVIDYWVEWDCDKWVIDLKSRRDDLWLPPGAITADRRKSAGAGAGPTSRRKSGDSAVEPKAPKKRPQCWRDDKQNGAYFVFKILDQLGTFQNDEGQTTQRKKYWTGPPLRASLPTKKGKSVKSEPVKGTFRIKFTNLQKPLVMTGDFAPNMKKLKSAPAPPAEAEYPQNTHATIVTNYWQNLRSLAPELGQAPLYLQAPLLQFKGNIRPEYTQFNGEAPVYQKPFAFNSSSNHLPNIGSLSAWAIEKMNPASHPPVGAAFPLIHTPKSQKSVNIPSPPLLNLQPEERKIEHSYVTRASKRFSTADTIVVHTSEGSDGAEGAMISTKKDASDVVEVAIIVGEPIVEQEATGTPISDRIKGRCSIDAIISSPEDGTTWHDAQEVL